MITLYLDIPILDSAARATQLLELLCQGGQFCLASHHPIDNCYGFPSTPFAVAHHAHNAVILLRQGCCWLVAAALFIWLPANGAGRDPSSVCGVDETVWHIKFLSHISDVGDCITGEKSGKPSMLPSLCGRGFQGALQAPWRGMGCPHSHPLFCRRRRRKRKGSW